jgi:hypothetical protein
VLADLDCQIYDFIPDSPLTPCVAVTVQRWPYSEIEDAQFVLWCIAGAVETKGAQERLMNWADSPSGSIKSLIDADSTLGGVVSNVLPLEFSWSINPVQEGQARYVQGQIVLNVLR